MRERARVSASTRLLRFASSAVLATSGVLAALLAIPLLGVVPMLAATLAAGCFAVALRPRRALLVWLLPAFLIVELALYLMGAG